MASNWEKHFGSPEKAAETIFLFGNNAPNQGADVAKKLHLLKCSPPHLTEWLQEECDE